MPHTDAVRPLGDLVNRIHKRLLETALWNQNVVLSLFLFILILTVLVVGALAVYGIITRNRIVRPKIRSTRWREAVRRT